MFSGRNFEAPELAGADISALRETARVARGDVLKMTTLATCGHPGGSMSSMEMYLLLWSCANVNPKDPWMQGRDRIVVSHGHTSPGVYAVLGRRGFFPVEQAVAHFRQMSSAFAGHVERCAPGVEWDSGNLGQGLSAAVGFALAGRVKKQPYRVFCLMGDGEQQKGQISEARRTAGKFGLRSLVAYVDLNGLQINGETKKVMPQNIAEGWDADGWHVVDVDGHDFQALYKATRAALAADKPTVLIAHTVMGKGVPSMENDAHWHGAALSEDQCRAALKELGLADDLDEFKKRRTGEKATTPWEQAYHIPPVHIATGTPRTYGPDVKTDNRSAWGAALADVANANKDAADATPIAVLDCDLLPSVKTGDFAKAMPGNFFQIGIQEHNTATISGAMSVCGVQTFFADFGVFGIDETYNQHRLSILNHTRQKIVCTHCGLDVGEDGKTHQCVDYVGLFRNLLGTELIVPADPNQTDRATRYIAQSGAMSLMVMGRSKMPMVLAGDGTPFFGGAYTFRYGKADTVRPGADAAIIVMGSLCNNAVKAHETLKKEGINAAVIHISSPLKPDVDAIRLAAATGRIVTVEDHVVTSGLGSIVAEVIAELGVTCKLTKLGVTHYGSSGKPDELYAEYGLDAAGIAQAVKKTME
ncbi:transketolase [bacterium]|nr:transketolase [bacterium]